MRLIETGLRPQFPGVIKFYNCHSATILTEKACEEEVKKLQEKNKEINDPYANGVISKQARQTYLKDIYPNKSTARNGADYLRKRGFRNCVFYGYLGPLGSEYADDGTGELHKTVDLNGLQNRPSHLHPLAKTAPASMGRIQV